MSEMVERVARAIHKAAGDPAWVFVGDDSDLSNVLIDGQVDLLEVARAAIEAMREPTDEMMVEAETVAPQLATFAEKEQSPSYRVWRAMIAEALS